MIAAHFEGEKSQGTSRAPRRRLLLEAEGALGSGKAASVRIHNVSATGLLFETDVELEEAESLELDLPSGGTRTAHIVWKNDSFFGCRFEAPLSPATLAELELRSQPEDKPEDAANAESLPVLLARLRKAQGLTLSAIAERLGVSKPTVWAWEQGRAKPTADRLAAIAELLGVDEQRLAGKPDQGRLQACIAQARTQVAEAFGVPPEQVRIMIDL